MTRSKHRRSMRYEALRSITDIEVTPYGVDGAINEYRFAITSYSSKTICISITQEKEFDQVSYAVISKPEKGIFKFSDNKSHYVLNTSDLKVSINKEAFGVAFSTLDDQLINQDEPGLSCGWMGQEASIYKTMQEDERFIGLGEKTGNLDRKGTGFTNWNTDAFAYATDGDPIYASIPFYIGIHNGLCYGLFLDNSYKSHFNFGASNNRFSSITVEGGDINYYFIHGKSIAEILFEYSKLTGRMELPPLWSLGYQQCRYSYYPDAKVIRLAETFREKKIPADVIYLDIHYMQDYKVFTWNKERFPDPIALREKLVEMGFKLVVITDPGVKKEVGYEPYDAGVKEDVFLKYPDGENYEGEVWPGWCTFPDFTDAKARKFWSTRVSQLMQEGVDGIWNDMNEIATWGQKLPDILEFNYEGEYSSAKRGRNVYGMEMARAAFEGCKDNDKDKRPFVLTRAGFAGIQRYSTLWTGDNVSYDDHMMVGVRLVNSLGLSGVPYAGYDVGGFVGEPSPSLYARWIALGAFSPFFRGHTMINSRDAEPWAFGEEVEEIARNYISLRYRLMPYVYSIFHEASQTGMPVSRSLAIDYTHDDNIYDTAYQNQYLFGPGFLIAPVNGDQNIVKVYLPGDSNWYELNSDTMYKGGNTYYFDMPIDKIPIFVKSGSIVPMQSVVQFTADAPDKVLEIHCYPGESTSFIYYEDAGEGYDYQKEKFLLWDMKYKSKDGSFSIKGISSNEKFKSKFDSLKLFIHGDVKHKIKVNGKLFSLKKEEYFFLHSISNFDPFIKPQEEKGVNVNVLEIPVKEIQLV